MPWKLPGPLVGTASQAAPNCCGGGASALLLGAASAVVVGAPPPEELESWLEPQAVSPTAATVILSATTIRLIRMVIPSAK
jgi:hypothetical protein